MDKMGSELHHFRKMILNLSAFELIYMDEFIDKLLRDERVCDIQLPRLQV
jgi:pre-mRNA-splicing factor 38A